MRFAILAAPPSPQLIVSGAHANGAHPRALPLLLSDRIANGEAFPGEHVVRLPRRFSRCFTVDAIDAALRNASFELRGSVSR